MKSSSLFNVPGNLNQALFCISVKYYKSFVFNVWFWHLWISLGISVEWSFGTGKHRGRLHSRNWGKWVILSTSYNLASHCIFLHPTRHGQSHLTLHGKSSIMPLKTNYLFIWILEILFVLDWILDFL